MSNMRESWQNSYLFGANGDFVEMLYESYLQNPESVELKWRQYFDSLQLGLNKKDIGHSQIVDKFAYITQNSYVASSDGNLAGATTNTISKSQARVWDLISNYRLLGMRYADLDPLQLQSRVLPQELSPESYGLAPELNNEFYVDSSCTKKAKLSDIINMLQAIYCNKISFEFSHITNLAERDWLVQYVENKYLTYALNKEEKIRILNKLVQAEVLERFLHTKFVGQKRFSVEGAESLIPLLDRILVQGAKLGLKEVDIGMAHRGRLNALVNITGKLPAKLFAEFTGNYQPGDLVSSNDVKYHKGYKCNYITPLGTVKTKITYNPSHLEIVNPVVNGIVRAVQDQATEIAEKLATMGVLIHGDSALIGLGTNQGVFNMSQTVANNVLGMFHITVNNQVGFTTSDIKDTRSSRFCTDIAKMVESPIIHVNADDVESLMFAIDLALDYRFKFNKDIMLEMVCFRRYGHNEADDPTLTQPYMYTKVKAHPGTPKVYAAKLVQDGVIGSDVYDSLVTAYRNGLDQGVHTDAENMQALPMYGQLNLKPIVAASVFDKVTTTITSDQIKQLMTSLTTIPNPDFKLHPTVMRMLDNRKLMGEGKLDFDFGSAENLAYAYLLQSGVSVRLAGEDSGRGTFSHRYAMLHATNMDDSAKNVYIPLKSLENNSKVYIYDSVLNEECAMAFEYGYSVENLKSLVIWEAQFGDFANGAQVVIDQFMSTGEAKWGQLNNLTLLLPHGMDGQGPEHSSARLERFLQLCAENNLQIIIPSTAAQLFHTLTRHGLSNYIKPMVIFMSKRLLRSKDAASPISEFSNGGFKFVIGDNLNNAEKAAKSIEKVMVCSGQVYYDLISKRKELALESRIAIIRVEQLYPFPRDLLVAELNKYLRAKEFMWVQEESYNQGAWIQIRDELNEALALAHKGDVKFRCCSRDASAAPACGTSKMHDEQLAKLLAEAFN